MVTYGGISARRHFRANSEPLKVQVEHLTCRSIHVTYLEGILFEKKLEQVGSGVQLRSGSGGGILARRHFRATYGPLKVQVEHLTF